MRTVSFRIKDGVRFIAINDHVDTINDRQDDIILPFKNLMNDAYCRDISIKIRSHLAVKRKNGENVMNLKEVLEYVDTIPFQQIEIRNLQKRKDELIERIAKVKSLRYHF